MKNAIKYFYNLDVNSIRQINNEFYLLINNSNYLLYEVEDDKSFVDKYEIISKIPYVHKIIKNNVGQINTIINNKLYSLMKIEIIDRNISYVDINYFEKILLYYNDEKCLKKYIELWSNKNDYIEYQMSQIGKKYSLLNSSYHYYIGLSETAIQLLNTISFKSLGIYLSHRRIKYNDTMIKLYNPYNIIFDFKTRDTSEYLKSKFYCGYDIFNDTISSLERYNNEEIVILFCRMLYPTYYFDLYEKIIKNEEKEESINKIIYKVDEYEKYIYNLYSYIKTKYIIADIDWIKKT